MGFTTLHSVLCRRLKRFVRWHSLYMAERLSLLRIDLLRSGYEPCGVVRVAISIPHFSVLQSPGQRAVALANNNAYINLSNRHNFIHRQRNSQVNSSLDTLQKKGNYFEAQCDNGTEPRRPAHRALARQAS